jgi:YD repeat-containing protein
MMKSLTILILLSLTSAAMAQYQNRTFYGPNGSVVGQSTTSSSGQTTFYDSHGQIAGRTQPLSGGTTVIYDAQGRRTGTVTTQGPFKK